jgi:hypothetical protein
MIALFWGGCVMQVIGSDRKVSGLAFDLDHNLYRSVGIEPPLFSD